MKTEYRYCELRADANAITGTVIRYGDRARIGQFFTEEFAPDSVKYNDVIVNIQHDRSKPVARLGSTLSIDKRDNEIVANIIPPDTTNGRDVRAMIDAGILRGLSMEFMADKDEWRENHRLITSATMMGIGIVDSPAYSDSEIQKRWSEWARMQIENPADFYYF